MVANRSHLAGLELALNEMAEHSPMARALGEYHLRPLIQQARSAPEPVQGEAVAIANKGDCAFWVKWTEAGKDLRGPGIKLYTHPADQVAPDSRVVPVELLERLAYFFKFDEMGDELRALLEVKSE